MKNLPVDSRIIQNVYFSKEDGQLWIRFKNGEERRFTGVPEDAAQAMCSANSPGQHYIEFIRTQFKRVAA
ncbi:KTSC domain-containing protein [Rhizobium sp. BE258]|uniref:KTSC domain-containing protein n=1 Tax=Rhizobium sp. BE258 TaxID=2817722 RepID=UPI002859500D|nr:KTSC domain-containing protein [Rhizobium sp. BE258]MDR7145227.1 hypothetical protein [Rhizobium sp. BE258]